MKLEKISSNMFRMTEQLDADTFNCCYQTSDGTVACSLRISHREKTIDVAVNKDLLNYKNSLSIIAHSIGILPVFMSNDNILIKNYFNYSVNITHKNFN